MQAHLRVHPIVEWMVAHNLLIEELQADLNPSTTPNASALIADAHSTRFGELLNSLPFEILAEVFDWTGRLEEPTTRARHFFPLRLSHVSNRWRKVSTRTPRLWTHLRVIVRGRFLGSALHSIRHWLERCGSCEMLIEVDFKEANGTEPAYLDDVLGLFRQVAKEAALHRHDFSMHRDGAIFETRLKATSLGVVPVIEERYLWYGGVQDVPDKENKLVAPLVIRGLRLAVDTFGLEYHSPLSASLTSVDLQDTNELYCLSSMELLIILAEFPVLKRCAAYINHSTMPQAERVLATNLEFLSLSWHYTVDVGPFLDQLTAPSLKELELMGDSPSGGAWDHLINFMQRSKPPVKDLTILHMDGNVARLEECLAVCSPTLQALWLEDCLLDDDFVRSLGERPRGRRSVLDGLQRLGLVSIEGIAGKRLVETLNSKAADKERRAEEESLLEVFVYDCPGVSEEDFQNMNQLGFRKVEYIDAMFCSDADMVEGSDDDSSGRS